MVYDRGKMSHFRRCKLAHLVSLDRNVKVSIQYFITIVDFICCVLSFRTTILLENELTTREISI